MSYFPSLEVSSAQIGFTSLFGMVRGCPYRYYHQSSIAKIAKNVPNAAFWRPKFLEKSSGATSSRSHTALSILRLGYIFSCGRLSYRATHHVFYDTLWVLERHKRITLRQCVGNRIGIACADYGNRCRKLHIVQCREQWLCLLRWRSFVLPYHYRFRNLQSSFAARMSYCGCLKDVALPKSGVYHSHKESIC